MMRASWWWTMIHDWFEQQHAWRVCDGLEQLMEEMLLTTTRQSACNGKARLLRSRGDATVIFMA